MDRWDPLGLGFVSWRTRSLLGRLAGPSRTGCVGCKTRCCASCCHLGQARPSGHRLYEGPPAHADGWASCYELGRAHIFWQIKFLDPVFKVLAHFMFYDLFSYGLMLLDLFICYIANLIFMFYSYLSCHKFIYCLYFK